MPCPLEIGYLEMPPRGNLLRALVSCLSISFAAQAWGQSDPSLLAKLREGGYVLYMRHTSTDFSQNDTSSRSFEDCANQRNLTDKGRDDARAVGDPTSRFGIPLGPVPASRPGGPLETAGLAFGKAQPMPAVRGAPARLDDPRRYEQLKELLSTPVPKGANLVISSHGNPFHAVAGPPYLAEGEIAVVRPEGSGRFTIVAKIRLGDWSGLRGAGGPS